MKKTRNPLINSSELFPLAKNLDFKREKGYIKSYPYILDFFKSRDKFTATDFVCGAHMVYGWMPTIISLNTDGIDADYEKGAELITIAKNTGSLKKEEIKLLSAMINNSLVGTSKLLHFVAPESFAIWDSKIYAFLYKRKPHNYLVQSIEDYFDYHSNLHALKTDPEFSNFLAIVIEKVGYKVSPLRALELVMFASSQKISGSAE